MGEDVFKFDGSFFISLRVGTFWLCSGIVAYFVFHFYISFVKYICYHQTLSTVSIMVLLDDQYVPFLLVSVQLYFP